MVVGVEHHLGEVPHGGELEGQGDGTVLHRVVLPAHPLVTFDPHLFGVQPEVGLSEMSVSQLTQAPGQEVFGGLWIIDRICFLMSLIQ